MPLHLSPDKEMFYRKFKTELENSIHFPSIYTYKFIVPTQADSAARLKELFDCMEASFSSKPSSRGTYTSITVSVMMASADDVIDKYRKAGDIDGVIML